jgi:hypothetical protein
MARTPSPPQGSLVFLEWEVRLARRVEAGQTEDTVCCMWFFSTTQMVDFNQAGRSQRPRGPDFALNMAQSRWHAFCFYDSQPIEG